MSTSSTNKRIARNTMFLYIRMLLIMAVSLYTSRLILKTLGVVDFGIYNVIGGLASSFVFFSSSLSNATQRFLNFELGKSNIEETKNIFNLSLLIYFILALLVLIIGEVIGIYLISNKLIIPQDRIDAAYWVFHSFMGSLVITLVSIVFDSVLIARENMKIYAYVGIFEAIGKLLIVFSLTWVGRDYLKTYAFFSFFYLLIVKSIPFIVCVKKYPECKFRYYWDKNLFIRMFKFVGWNGYGTAVYAINEQGTNILLNLFFGPAINAARAIAVQVKSAVNNFSNNFLLATRPQIVKSYAVGDIPYFLRLIFDSSRYSFYLLWILCLPIILRIEYILTLWLGDFPEFTAEFVVWTLFFMLVNILTSPIWSAIQAIGKLKKYVLLGSTIFLMAFPIGYLFLLWDYSPIVVSQVLVVVRLIYLFSTILILKSYINLSIKKYLIEVISPILLVLVLSALVMSQIDNLISQNFLGLIAEITISFIVTILSIYIFGLNRIERTFINKKLTVLCLK